MAGSMKWVSYTDKRGNTFALKHDESNWEAVNGSGHDVTEANLADHIYSIPGNLRPRLAWYRSTTTVKVRKIAVATEAIFDDLVDGSGVRSFTDDGETFRFYRTTPEEFRPVVIEFDSGLNDGDAS